MRPVRGSLQSGSSPQLASTSSLSLFRMPVAVMSEQEQTEFINKLEGSLGSVLDEKGVRRDVQAVISQLDIRNCETFAMMESTTERCRERLHSDDVGLGRTGADKVQTSNVVCAWEAPVGRTTAQRNLEAEQRTAGLPAAIPGGMFVTVRRAWESHLEVGQTISLSELPAKSFLEWRIAQVDDGEFHTESLADVASQEEAGALNEDTTADLVREGE